MVTANTTTRTFRIEPALYKRLRVVGDCKRRFIGDAMEVLLRDQCGLDGSVSCHSHQEHDV